jgi:hypothetical protein
MPDIWMPHEGQVSVENDSKVAFSHAKKMGVEIRAEEERNMTEFKSRRMGIGNLSLADLNHPFALPLSEVSLLSSLREVPEAIGLLNRPQGKRLSFFKSRILVIN